MEEKHIKYNLITIVVISLLIGGLSGGAAGFMAASFFSGSFGQWLTNPLGREIAKYQPGTVISLKVAHDGFEKAVQVELGEYPN